MVGGRNGFTLVEMSIVLVIIGLVVGGVLVGRDLVASARIRAQTGQLSKYKAAVNAFRVKYDYLPGDLPGSRASAYGFVARDSAAGRGDGNGALQGTLNSSIAGNYPFQGETLLLWEDLSTAGMIDGSFSAYDGVGDHPQAIPDAARGQYLPEARIGGDNFVMAWGGMNPGAGGLSNLSANNYFLVAPLSMNVFNRPPATYTGLSVQQAYGIDSKMDDGQPQTGKIVALFPTQCNSMGYYTFWSSGSHTDATNAGCMLSDFVNRTQVFPYTTATPAAATTCYDNDNTAGTAQHYSLGSASDSTNCVVSYNFM